MAATEKEKGLLQEQDTRSFISEWSSSTFAATTAAVAKSFHGILSSSYGKYHYQFRFLMCRCHIRVGQSRHCKTWQEIQAFQAWIRHDIVQLFFRTCEECSTCKNTPAGKAITTQNFLTRIHVNLIGMTSRFFTTKFFVA